MIRQYEIGEKVLLSKYNVSRLVDRLEAAGHVKRMACPEDGRGSLVVLTASGRNLLRRMWPVYEAAITRHFASRLTNDELAQLTALMDKIFWQRRSDREPGPRRSRGCVERFPAQLVSAADVDAPQGCSRPKHLGAVLRSAQPIESTWDLWPKTMGKSLVNP